MDEDAKDARSASEGVDSDEKVDGSDRSSSTRDREPATLKAMRTLAETVDKDEAVSVELELIAEKLGVMGGAGCGVELWRRVR